MPAQARKPAVLSRRLLGRVIVQVLVSVASETDCQNCHTTGQMAADDPTIAWSNDSDLEVQSKKNILILHDTAEGTNLTN